MRKFSETEKVIIRDLVSNTCASLSFVAINVYNSVFQDRNVKYEDGYLVFGVDSNTNVDFQELLSIEREVLAISFLLNYLIENRYIYLIDDKTTAGRLTSIGGPLKDGLSPINKDMDDRVCEILNDAMNHRVFVSEDLKQLVADNFKTLDEVALEESKKQTKYSRRSFYIAMIALFISIIIPLFASKYSSQEDYNNNLYLDKILERSSVGDSSTPDVILCRDTVEVRCSEHDCVQD